MSAVLFFLKAKARLPLVKVRLSRANVRFWAGVFVPLLAMAVILAGSATRSAGGPSAAARVVVGPNILVTHDLNAARDESWLAADPTDARHLVGAVSTLRYNETGPDRFDTTHVSFDGGNTWVETDLLEPMHKGSGDPQVAFGPDGTAYFVTLGDDHTLVYRSSDGLHWKGPARFVEIDHERVVADATRGPHHGRLYVMGERTLPVKNSSLPRFSGVLVLRSDDGGKTFSAPRIAASTDLARGDRYRGGGDQVSSALVLRDGSLLIGVLLYPANPDFKHRDSYKLTALRSRDYGQTFGREIPIASFRVAAVTPHYPIADDRTQHWSLPEFAVDQTNGAYRDRIYAVWDDVASGSARLWSSYSADMGSTWSAPKPINPAWTNGDGDHQPNIIVNRDGVVGIIFYHTDKSTRDKFDAEFTVSGDGGRSFQQPVRVSEEPSYPLAGNGMLPFPDQQEETASGIEETFNSGLTWASGGDTIGLVASNDGLFHPFWTDARHGMYQLYTARISVNTALASTASDAPGPIVALNKNVHLIFDPIKYDESTHVLSYPIRIQNSSPNAISGPVTVALRDLGKGSSPRPADFSIENAVNGKTGYGAVFDYSQALGTSGVLQPGDVSSPVVWRVKVIHPLAFSYSALSFDVRGRTK